MINYLIMEDNINDLLIYRNIIDKVMMNYDINYKISNPYMISTVAF